jgi:glycosyltransferase involved in cell wall biosynthesis
MRNDSKTSNANTLPHVSVIIPTHNREEMLHRAVDSVLRQNYEDFELIIVSDGSTDNTEHIVEAFNDPRITLLKHKTSRGASAARNTGMRIAKGKYIAFLDDDDEWTVNKLEVQMPIIENSSQETGLVYAWMEYFHNGKSLNVCTPKLRGNVFVEMLDRQAIGGCPTIIIKREVINKVGYFDEELPRGNDGDFIRRIAKHFEVDYVSEILCKVHIGHLDRIGVNSKESLRNHIKSAMTRLSKFREDFKPYPEAESKILYDMIRAYVKLNEGKSALRCALRIISLLNIRIDRWFTFANKIL